MSVSGRLWDSAALFPGEGYGKVAGCCENDNKLRSSFYIYHAVHCNLMFNIIQQMHRQHRHIMHTLPKYTASSVTEGHTNN